MTKIINLFGGPGTGKSTTAALVYAEMKQRGFKVELVREVAKELLYRGEHNLLRDQAYVSIMQERRLLDVINAAPDHRPDFVVTDSPLLLGVVYCKSDDGLELTITKRFVQHCNVNFLLTRTFPYATDGRMEAEDVALAKHREVERVLRPYQHYKVLSGDVNTIITFATQVHN